MGRRRRLIFAFLTLGVAWLSVVFLRATAAPDLCDNAQAKQAAYAVDLYYNGNWIVQRDHEGSVQTKPPAYNWLVGLFAWARGRLDTVALYAPCAGSFLGLVLTAAFFAHRVYGRADIAVLAGVAVMASSLGLKLAWLARTDTLFAFLTWTSFIVGYAALHRSRLWMVFWAFVTCATLAKGPLCLLFVGVGLAGAAVRNGTTVRLGWAFWVGMFLFLCLTLGWLGWATAIAGPEVPRTLLGRELIQHALFGVEWRFPFSNFYKPPVSFFARMAPWSILATLGVVQALRNGKLAPPLAALAAYVYGGLAMLMVSPHHRADHLAPLMPGVAVLAVLPFLQYRRLAEKPFAVPLASASLFAIGLIAGYAYYHLVRPTQPPVQRTAMVRQAASWLARSAGSELVYGFHATGALDWYAREAGRSQGVSCCGSLPPPEDCRYLVTLRPDLADPVLVGRHWRRLPLRLGRATKGTLVVYERKATRTAHRRQAEPPGNNALR